MLTSLPLSSLKYKGSLLSSSKSSIYSQLRIKNTSKYFDSLNFPSQSNLSISSFTTNAINNSSLAYRSILGSNHNNINNSIPHSTSTLSQISLITVNNRSYSSTSSLAYTATPRLNFSFSSTLLSSSTTSSTSSARSNALLTALKQIESSFGKGTVMNLGQHSQQGTIIPMTEVIPSGSLALDYALGIGGFPKGRVVEIYGQESSGKTTLALHVIAEAQKRNLTCVFVDAEHALDANYASKLGVNLEKLYITQPDTGEAALEVTDTLVRSGGVDVVVVDSVAALVPKAELEGEMGDSHIGLQARLMSQALRKLTASLARSKTLIIFLNQIRSKIGVMFGNPDVTSGGNALKFYSSIRCEVKRASIIKEKGTKSSGNSADEQAVGNIIRVKVSKNKLAPPFRIAEFEMTYGHGISRAAEALDLGLQTGLVKLSGSYYSITDNQVIEDMNKAIEKDATGKANTAKPVIVSNIPTPANIPSPKTKKGKKGSKNKDVPMEVPAVTTATTEGTPAADNAATTDASSTATPSSSLTSTTVPSSIPITFPILKLGEHFSQGKERTKTFLDTYPTAREVLYEAVRKSLASKNIPLPTSEGDE